MVGQEDTICAIATGRMNSGIGIVRISGTRALAIADTIFTKQRVEPTDNEALPSKKQSTKEEGDKDPKKEAFSLKKVPSHTVHYGWIVDEGELLDEVMVLVFRAPKSYTKEDVIEIDCHGGNLVTRRVLEAVCRNGARLAEPGEFTKRAFLHGRIDMSQAEAVMALIDAKNQSAMKQSVLQLRGGLKEKIKEYRLLLLHDLSYIEAALDDPEHMDIDTYRETLSMHTKDLCQKTQKMLFTYHNGRLLREGIRTVILGKPNVGKSTLLNFLAKEDRAIVTEQEGTTRDLLDVSVTIDDLTLHLTDTAGIRNTEDLVEKIGVQRAKERAKDAELILYLFDAGTKVTKEEFETIEMFDKDKILFLLNKSDLCAVTTKEELEKKLSSSVISISAKEQKGMEELYKQILSKCLDGQNELNELSLIANERQKQALMEASSALDRAMESIEKQMPEDFISIDLMEAYEAFGRIIGEALEEDLISHIFENFCMGK